MLSDAFGWKVVTVVLETFFLGQLLRLVPTNTVHEYFCAVYDYAGKADLSKGYKKSKKKIWANHEFFRDYFLDNYSEKQ